MCLLATNFIHSTPPKSTYFVCFAERYHAIAHLISPSFEVELSIECLHNYDYVLILNAIDLTGMLVHLNYSQACETILATRRTK